MSDEELPMPLARIREVAMPATTVHELDALDIALLKILTGDCRGSQRQIAAALGVTAPTVGDRMARLERAGVITGYRVEINWAAVGYGQVVVLSVQAAPDQDVAAIMAALWTVAEVEDVTLVTGDLDLLVRMRVRDYDHLRQLLMNQIWQITGMQRTITLMSIAEMPTKPFSTGLLTELEQPVGTDGG
jgi:Lrp/AsnC family transcriptional regulator, leucine-responsive regulatory protein